MRKCLEQSLIESFLVLQHLICVPSVLLFYTHVMHGSHLQTNSIVISSMLQQYSYYVPLPLPCGGYERCDSKLVCKIRVCSILQKIFCHHGVPLRGRVE